MRHVDILCLGSFYSVLLIGWIEEMWTLEVELRGVSETGEGAGDVRKLETATRTLEEQKTMERFDTEIGLGGKWNL